MKPLLLLSILALAACGKSRCYNCDSTMSNIALGTTFSSKVKMCGKTRSEIKEAEKNGTKSWYSVNANGDTVRQSSTYTCKMEW